MKGRRISYIQPASLKVDNRGQQYLVYPNGQMRRVSSDGTFLPRVKMSKKERLKFRQEYARVKDLKVKELATKILETPVVNPVIKFIPELGNLPAEELKMEIADA